MFMCENWQIGKEWEIVKLTKILIVLVCVVAGDILIVLCCQWLLVASQGKVGYDNHAIKLQWLLCGDLMLFFLLMLFFYSELPISRPTMERGMSCGRGLIDIQYVLYGNADGCKSDSAFAVLLGKCQGKNNCNSVRK